MVGLFMRRMALVESGSGSSFPPVHDSIRYYWNGYDLAGLTTETGWPDRINGSMYDFYQSTIGEEINDPDNKYYKVKNNALLRIGSNATGDGFDNAYWVNGDDSESTEDWTVELVTCLDFTDPVSDAILGSGTVGIGYLRVVATLEAGLSIQVGTTSFQLSTGPVANGFHIYAISRTYNASEKRYYYIAYLDGEEVARYEKVSATLKHCKNAYLGHAVGCIVAHGRALNAAEIRKNSAYYQKWWRPDPVLGIYTENATFVAPKDGVYNIHAVGAGGRGGAGSRYSQTMIDKAAEGADSEYNKSYYGGLSGGGGGGAGGWAESNLTLSKGDTVSMSFTGSATVVEVNGETVMTANNGSAGESGITRNSTTDSVSRPYWETATYAGGAGGTASGGNVKNEIGESGEDSYAVIEPTGTTGTDNYGGAGGAAFLGHGYAIYGGGGKGGRGHVVFGSYDDSQFFGDNYGSAGASGAVIINEAS